MEEELLRVKCRRWHSSMMRSDRYTWTDLLSNDFSWFYYKVNERLGNYDENKKIDFIECIEKANLEELKKLFSKIDEYRIEKRYGK